MKAAYTLEFIDVTGQPFATPYRRNKPTVEKMIEDLREYARAYEPGGRLEFVSQRLGHIPYPAAATVVRNKTGKTVIEWEAPPGMVW